MAATDASAPRLHSVSDLDLSWGRGSVPGGHDHDSPPVPAVARFASAMRLSIRETDVLSQACLGCSMKEAAAQLGISVKTVENYWTRIYAKTREVSQLAVLAQLVRWLAADESGGVTSTAEDGSAPTTS